MKASENFQLPFRDSASWDGQPTEDQQPFNSLSGIQRCQGRVSRAIDLSTPFPGFKASEYFGESAKNPFNSLSGIHLEDAVNDVEEYIFQLPFRDSPKTDRNSGRHLHFQLPFRDSWLGGLPRGGGPSLSTPFPGFRDSEKKR